MPNRFYQNQGQGLDLNRVLGPIATIKGWEDTAADLALKKQALEETTRQHGVTAGIQQGNLDVNRGQLDVQRQNAQTAAAKLNPREKNYAISDHLMFANNIRKAGFDPEKLDFMKEKYDQAKDMNVNRGLLADTEEAEWDVRKHTYVDQLTKQVDGILQKDPNADVRKQLGLIDAVSTMSQDQVKQTFFPDIARHDTESKAAMQAATLASRVQMTSPDRLTYNALVEQGVSPIEALRQVEATKKEGKFAPTVHVNTGERPEITAERERKNERQNAMDIAKAETLILTNKSNEGVGAEVELFNQVAKKPYAYQWKPGKLYGGTWEKTKLPVINKKQVTAKDVYDTATKHGMTYEDVLNQIMEKK